MSLFTTLTGGPWQDPHGIVVANGTLVLTLSQDAQISGGGQAAPRTVSFALDSSGNVNGATVYGNDILSPAGTFYSAEVLNSGGSRVWGPEIWVLVSNTTTNPGLIVPTTTGGGITVSVPTLQTNGVNNSSQSLLNLQSGSGITVTNPSSGNVSIAFSGAGAPNFTTAGTAGFWGAGFFQIPLGVISSSSQLNGADNQVRVTQFSMLYGITISRVVFNVGGGSNGTLFSFAIYSANGNTKIVDSGVYTVSGTGVQTKTITPVSLVAGTTYFFAQTTNSAVNITGNSIGSINGNVLATVNANATRSGTAANPSVSGAMPATLGALSADNVANTFVAAVFFES